MGQLLQQQKQHSQQSEAGVAPFIDSLLFGTIVEVFCKFLYIEYPLQRQEQKGNMEKLEEATSSKTIDSKVCISFFFDYR